MRFFPLSIFVIILTLFSGVVSAKDLSMNVGECRLSFHVDDRWKSLGLRPWHPQHQPCSIDPKSVSKLLKNGLRKKPKNFELYTSLSIGRLIDYPWAVEYLAETALQDPSWDVKRGRPRLGEYYNDYVKRILNAKSVIEPFQKGLQSSGATIVGVSVEKVLLEKRPGGKLPIDAQVWFQLEGEPP